MPPDGYQPVPASDPSEVESGTRAPPGDAAGEHGSQPTLWEKIRGLVRRYLVPVLVTAAIVLVILLGAVLLFARPSSPGDNTPPVERQPHKGPPKNYIDPHSDWTWSRFRLPTHAIPEHYDLDFETALEGDASAMKDKDDSFNFGGTVTISLDWKEERNYVVFNSHLLVLDEIELLNDDESSKMTPAKINIDSTQRQISVIFRDMVKPGKYKLRMNYRGELYQQLRGYYLSQYKDDNNKLHYLATTQFEATDARRAFPCLDEPILKATFSINMTVPAKYHALSNMDPLDISMDSEKGLKRYSFRETKRMSTYLVAFIVHNFEYVENKTKSGKRVRVYTAPGKTYQGNFALDCAVKTIDHYEYIYDIEYALPKEDLVAIPDFGPGAMENWGLITYRNTDLLIDPATSSAGNRQRVASVVAHELAHQWFGNLVTMNWWDSLWLNEGFATYMEYQGANAVHPEYHMIEQFFITDTIRALARDGGEYTHAIHLNLEDPAQIDEIFDEISYSKGGSALRMLDSYLSQVSKPAKVRINPFFDGLHRYLTKHKFGNAKTTDLWEALNEPDVGVPEFMSTWTEQPGYPVIEIHAEDEEDGHDSPRNARDVSLHAWKITQERFFNNPALKGSSDQTWIVPFTYQVFTNSTGTPELQVPTKLIKMENKSTVIDTRPQAQEFYITEQLDLRGDSDMQRGFDRPVALVKGNVDQNGFYRVQLPPRMIKIASEWLIAHPNFIGPLDRAGMLEDAFAMLMAGRMEDPADALGMLSFLSKETDTNVWYIAIEKFITLDRLLSLSSGYGHFQSYVWDLMDDILGRTGWEETGQKGDENAHLRAILRGRLYSFAIRIGHPRVVKQALVYAALLKDGKKAPVELSTLSAIYAAAVRHGGEEFYSWILKEYYKAKFATDKSRFLFALAGPQEPHLIERSLEIAISGDVRSQDALRFVASIARLSPLGPRITWTFLRDNWSQILKQFGEASSFGNINAVLTVVTSLFTSKSMIADVEEVRKNAPDADFSHQKPGLKAFAKEAVQDEKFVLEDPGMLSAFAMDQFDEFVKLEKHKELVNNLAQADEGNEPDQKRDESPVEAPVFSLPPLAGESIDRGLNSSKTMVRWLERYGQPVQNWFRKEAREA